MKRYPLILLCSFGAVLFALTGCETTKSASSSSESKPPVILYKGMPAEEIVELLGEPKKVEQKGPDRETWIYEKTREITRRVEAETREVPYVDPITGIMMMRTESVPGVEMGRQTLVTELFIEDGFLEGWQESLRESKDTY